MAKWARGDSLNNYNFQGLIYLGHFFLLQFYMLMLINCLGINQLDGNIIKSSFFFYAVTPFVTT